MVSGHLMGYLSKRPDTGLLDYAALAIPFFGLSGWAVATVMQNNTAGKQHAKYG